MLTESWKKTRMRVLVRDDFCCQAQKMGLIGHRCKATDLDDLHVHHLRERVRGGSDALDNLITLCREHHEQIHPWMRKIKPLTSNEVDYPWREL
ncbi:MAG: HNH endonuclease [Chloroflexota bacterium]